MVDRVKQMVDIQTECLELFKKKNHDYGDSFADYGVVGVLIRMNDKLKRYVSVSNNGVSLVNDEALRDTLKDLHNYSAMAIMLVDESHERVFNSVVDELVDVNKEPWFNKNESHIYVDVSEEEAKIETI